MDMIKKHTIKDSNDYPLVLSMIQFGHFRYIWSVSRFNGWKLSDRMPKFILNKKVEVNPDYKEKKNYYPDLEELAKHTTKDSGDLVERVEYMAKKEFPSSEIMWIEDFEEMYKPDEYYED